MEEVDGVIGEIDVGDRVTGHKTRSAMGRRGDGGHSRRLRGRQGRGRPKHAKRQGKRRGIGKRKQRERETEHFRKTDVVRLPPTDKQTVRYLCLFAP